ncbi:MAG: HAD hydrolase family protein [Nannocystales bacterium]
MPDLAQAALLAFDIDGTLTDATTWWGGPELGWLQRYSVRDGEALLRIKRRIPTVPLSRNKTLAARVRMEGLGMDTRWVGTSDKIASLEEICDAFGVTPERVCHIGDGPDDADVFEAVGYGVAVADAHPIALEAAAVVLDAAGGARAIEELDLRMGGAR